MALSNEEIALVLEQLLTKVNDIANQIEGQKHLHKDILTHKEASEYLGYTTTYLHKLCHKRVLPYFQPNGKNKYYRKDELANWLLRNRKESIDERADRFY
jgi:excisionase family DNA binding protein